jgi:hypothetical protein
MSDIAVVAKLPRAIVKHKDGIDLYWIEESGIAGIHVRGIAKLLECNPKTVASAIEANQQIAPLEAEVLTKQGLRTVTLVTEADLAKILRCIAKSKAKIETRDRADDVLDRLIAAGFKLAVMLELAPAKLVEMATENLVTQSQLDEFRERLTTIEQRFVTSQHKALPKASVDPVPGKIQALTERQCCNKLIAGYVFRKNQNLAPEEEKKTEQEVTRWMYRELKPRYKYDVYARFKNSKHKSKIDMIEADGRLPQLHAICNHFLGA